MQKRTNSKKLKPNFVDKYSHNNYLNQDTQITEMKILSNNYRELRTKNIKKNITNIINYSLEPRIVVAVSKIPCSTRKSC
jgi:hypothetical protein